MATTRLPADKDPNTVATCTDPNGQEWAWLRCGHVNGTPAYCIQKLSKAGVPMGDRWHGDTLVFDAYAKPDGRNATLIMTSDEAVAVWERVQREGR